MKLDNERINMQTTSDGWRAIIADGFTFENVRRITWAIGQYLLNLNRFPNVLIAFDTRFMGESFAKVIADTLNAQNISCDISKFPIPTPTLSWYTFKKKYDIGLAVTASHNPPHYNGIKIRMPYGGPPDKKITGIIEKLIPVDTPRIFSNRKIINWIDPLPEYIEMIRGYINLEVIDSYAPIISIDSMHGTTAGIMKSVLKGTRARIFPVRDKRDPLFGGYSPEPKVDTIQPLINNVLKHNSNIGFAHDGDGDRIVAFSPDVGYLSPNDLLILLIFELSQTRNQPGAIVSSVSTTRRARIAAKLLGREFFEVPIGFHNAAELMRKQSVLIAGEENGGIGLGIHMPERDGILIASLLTEMISTQNGSIKEFINSINLIVGVSKYSRNDIKVEYPPNKIIDRITKQRPQTIAGFNVKEFSNLDGVKFTFEQGEWLLIRAAGTEPVIRLYVEADDYLSCNKLLDFVKEKYINA